MYVIPGWWALGAEAVYLAHEEQKSMQGKDLGSLFLVLSVMDFWSDVLWCRIRYKRHDEKKQTYTGDGFSTQQIPERDPDEMVFMTASTAVIGLTTVLTLMAITRLVYRQSKKQYMNVNKLPDKATIVILVCDERGQEGCQLGLRCQGRLRFMVPHLAMAKHEESIAPPTSGKCP